VAVNGCVSGTGPYEAWRDGGFQTDASKHIYNANQVWYGRESQPVSLGGGGEFGNNDIAIITLDTHVSNVPTWTLLFSPLTGSTHVTITGYGAAGVGTTGIGDAAGIDYRRRVAENMIDGLFSSANWFHTSAVGGPGGYNGFDEEAIRSIGWTSTIRLMIRTTRSLPRIPRSFLRMSTRTRPRSTGIRTTLAAARYRMRAPLAAAIPAVR